MLSGPGSVVHFYIMWKHAKQTVLYKHRSSPVLWVTVPEALCKGIAGYLQLRDLKSGENQINLSVVYTAHIHNVISISIHVAVIGCESHFIKCIFQNHFNHFF